MRMADSPQRVAGTHNVTAVYPTGSASSFNRYAFTTPKEFPEGVTGLVIDDVVLVSDTGVTAHDTNYWSFQIANLTDAGNLMAAAVTTKATGGTAITADTGYRLTPDQNNTLGVMEVIEFQATEAATATDLSGAQLMLSVKWHWKMEA